MTSHTNANRFARMAAREIHSVPSPASKTRPTERPEAVQEVIETVAKLEDVDVGELSLEDCAFAPDDIFDCVPTQKQFLPSKIGSRYRSTESGDDH
jgi:hypothetical protein